MDEIGYVEIVMQNYDHIQSINITFVARNKMTTQAKSISISYSWSTSRAHIKKILLINDNRGKCISSVTGLRFISFRLRLHDIKALATNVTFLPIIIF